MVILFFMWLDFWYQSDWSGGGGQGVWSDTTKFFNKQNISYSRVPGCILLDAPNGWTATGLLEGVTNIWALVETQDSIIYAGGDSVALKGFVFKSDDLGNTWINTNIPTCSWVHCLIEYHTGTIYAGTDQGVFKYDGSWSSAGLSAAVNDLIETSDSVLYAGTWDGKIYSSTDGSGWTPLTVNNGVRIWDIISVNDTLYAGGIRNIGATQFPGVFKSTDGTTFDTTGFPHEDKTVYTLLLAQDGKIYAGTGPDSGKVFKTSNGGNTWDTTQTMEWAECVYSLLQSDYGTIYAGTGTLEGALYSSNNGGQTWTFEDINPTISSIYSLLQTANGVLYAGTIKGAGSTTAVWKAGYFSAGWLKSSSYEAYFTDDVNYDSVFWDVTLNGGNVEVWIRTNTVPDMWGVDSFRIINQGDTIPDAFDNKRYIQYQVKLSSPSPDSSPIFKQIKIYYTPHIGVEEQGVPSFSLTCYPNPVAQVVKIIYWIPNHQQLTTNHQIKIYDGAGRLVKTLVDEEKEAGYHELNWDTQDIPQGVYFIRFGTPNYKEIQKIIIIK